MWARISHRCRLPVRLAGVLALLVIAGGGDFSPVHAQAALEPTLQAADDAASGLSVLPLVPPEFEFRSGGPDRWTAPNRHHGFRSAATAATLEVSPRAAAADWSWILVTQRFGRGENLFPWPEHFGSIADRGEVRFPAADLESWVRNEPCGLEHGWSVLTPPTAAVDGGALVIELLSIGLVPRLTGGGVEILLATPSGTDVLVYSGLLAWDADGIELPSHLEVVGDAIRIVVDDRGAKYPVEIDPVVTAPAFWTVDGDQGGAEFGVAISGGADLTGDGIDDLVVGASDYDSGDVDEGMVFLYPGAAPSAPSTGAIWFAEGNDPSARLGADVAVVGDVNGDGFADLLIGAPGARDSGQAVGGAYIYYGPLPAIGPASVGPLNADWMDFGPNLGSGFGTAVADAGDLNGDGLSDIIIGAPQALVGGQARGRAYVYLGSPTGPVSPPLVVDGVASGDQFGASVASAGNFDGDLFERDEILVGAPNHASGAMVAVGAAYAYRLDATGTQLEPIWEVIGTEPSASLGSAVAGGADVDGLGVDDVVIGAYLRNSPGPVSDAGAIHLFQGEDIASLPGASLPLSVVPADASWTVFGDQTGETLGGAVAMVPDLDEDLLADIVAGARLYDLGTAAGSNAGRVAAFLGKEIMADIDAGLLPGTFRTVNGTGDRIYEGTNGGFGIEVAAVGDLDGDGFGDIAIGAHGYDGAIVNQGRVQVRVGFADCNGNLIPDDQESLLEDCDMDGLPDDCEDDCDANGIPDDCEGTIATHAWVGSFSVPAAVETAVPCTGAELVPPQASCGFTATGALIDLDVSVEATFSTTTFLLRLTHPSGFPSVLLYDGLGGVTSGTATLFDDDGAAGTLAPVEPLGLFDLLGVTGEWVLSAEVPVGESLTITAITLTAEFLDPSFGDCNGNGLRDRCEIADGLVLDCNGDLVVDSCQDSDGDGIADACDNCPNDFNPKQTDLDGDGVGNTCDICLNFDNSIDADADGIPDLCDNCPNTPNPLQLDCDSDGIGDVCEIDCDQNGFPDDCDILLGLATDCDQNGQLDSCDIAAGAPDCNLNGQIDTCEGLADCDGNGVYDECDLLAGTHVDCDGNGVPDICDLAAGAPDCDADGILDSCQIADGSRLDCNANLVPDACDLLSLTSNDCNSDGIPDDCQPDCDGDGIPDDCETDCDGNGIPDDCDLLAGTDTDCDGNGVLDGCDLAAGAPDCDADGLLDSCQIADGSRLDCNLNGVPDLCDLAAGTSTDCNLDLVPDDCQPDCDGNGVPDDCEPDCDGDGLADPCAILAGSGDCDGNGIPDECQPDCDSDGTPDACETDCDGNGVPDDCDLSAGTHTDCNGNLIPDVCDLANGIQPDTTPPVIVGQPANQVLSADLGFCATTATWTPPTASDDCVLVSFVASHQPGDAFPVGTTVVTLTATDLFENTALITFSITVTDDEAPTLSGIPAAMTLENVPGQCGAIVTWTGPTVLDNCPGATLTSTHASGDFFPIGTTTVTFTGTDASGLTVTGSFDVTVTDGESPMFGGLPLSFAVPANLGGCTASATWTEPTVTDNCPGVTYVASHASGASFPLGDTEVTYTATDAAGHVSTATFTVSVIDDQPPQIFATPANLTVANDPGLCGAAVTWDEATASDNCPPPTLTSDFANGSVFPVGTTLVTYTATDGSGNAVQTSFSVTVEDTEAPSLVGLPTALTVSNDPGLCGATVSWPEVTASDNCAGATVSSTIASGTLFAVGDTTVTYTATDGAGNTASGSFVVTVVDDELPSLLAGAPIIVPGDPLACGAEVTVTAPVETDNCAVDTMTNSFTGTADASGFYPAGTTLVTFTVTDIHGNVGTTTVSVTVDLPMDDCNGNGIPDVCDIAQGTSVDCAVLGGIPDGIPDECQPDCDLDSIPDVCEPDCDGDGLPDDCEVGTDCNQNGIPDECDIDQGVSLDCDGNGLPDECQIASGSAQDCDLDGVIDACEIASGAEADCNLDGIPDDCQALPDCDGDGLFDVCESDCDGDGVPDDCDSEPDCNQNGVPDNCDVAVGGASNDCNTNGIPDECEPDCNGNGIPDACDLGGVFPDCNANGIPDSCEIELGFVQDCQPDGIPDECQPDCDSDGIPDSCEEDCDGNGLPNDCEPDIDIDCDQNGIPDLCETDCDGNGVNDVCDIIQGTYLDQDGNGVPDVCECPELGPLVCTVVGGQVTLDWSGSSTTYQSIEVRRNGVLQDVMAGTSSSFTMDMNLTTECLNSSIFSVVGICPNLATTPEVSCFVDIVPPLAYEFEMPDVSVEYPANWSETTFTVEPLVRESSLNPCFPNPTLGLSMGVRNDPAVLAPISLSATNELNAAVGGGGVEFFSQDLFADGWTLGVLYSIVAPQVSVAFAQDLPVARVTYRTTCALSGLPASTTGLSFTTGPDDLGTPPVSNVVVVEGLEFTPSFVDGTVSLNPVGEVAFLRGDCNTSGSLTLADAIAMLNLIFGNGGATTCNDACDANDSGSLTIGDPIWVLSYQFQSGPPPSAPFPECGLDPSPDLLDCAAFGVCPTCTD